MSFNSVQSIFKSLVGLNSVPGRKKIVFKDPVIFGLDRLISINYIFTYILPSKQGIS